MAERKEQVSERTNMTSCGEAKPFGKKTDANLIM